jgi:hypothetical protein
VDGGLPGAVWVIRFCRDKGVVPGWLRVLLSHPFAKGAKGWGTQLFLSDIEHKGRVAESGVHWLRRTGRRQSADRTESTCEIPKPKILTNLLFAWAQRTTGVITKEVRHGQSPLSRPSQP